MLITLVLNKKCKYPLRHQSAVYLGYELYHYLPTISITIIALLISDKLLKQLNNIINVKKSVLMNNSATFSTKISLYFSFFSLRVKGSSKEREKTIQKVALYDSSLKLCEQKSMNEYVCRKERENLHITSIPICLCAAQVCY